MPSRPGIGFSEFENEMQSAMALNRVQVRVPLPPPFPFPSPLFLASYRGKNRAQRFSGFSVQWLKALDDFLALLRKRDLFPRQQKVTKREFQMQILRFFKKKNPTSSPLHNASTPSLSPSCRERERYRERDRERERTKKSARGRERNAERQRERETPVATATLLPSFSAASYRGTSLTRKRTLTGPYRRPMPRVIGGSKGGQRGVVGGWAEQDLREWGADASPV